MTGITSILFDSYDTLFDSRPLTRLAESLFGEQGQRLTRLWRNRQLDYAWVRTLTGSYADFWHITRDALLSSAAALDLPLPPTVLHRFMRCYMVLPAFPDVLPSMQTLAADSRPLAILSQGTPAMLRSLVTRNGLAGLIRPLISADDIRAYKPSPLPYAEAVRRIGGSPGQTLFVTAHGWDLAGAIAAGLPTAWLNRKQEPLERLGIKPDMVLQDLKELLLAMENRGTLSD